MLKKKNSTVKNIIGPVKSLSTDQNAKDRLIPYAYKYLPQLFLYFLPREGMIPEKRLGHVNYLRYLPCWVLG